MSYKVITPASVQPVQLEELKEHLGIYHSEKDYNLTLLLKSAVKVAETFTGRVFRCGGEVQELHLCEFAQLAVVETAPVTGIESVKYFDLGNNEQTLATGLYHAGINAVPAVVVFGNTPATYPRPDAVKIQFTAGYPYPDAVPEDVRAAILLIAQYLYENPGDSVRQLPTTSEWILKNHKIY